MVTRLFAQVMLDLPVRKKKRKEKVEDEGFCQLNSKYLGINSNFIFFI
jgi:hypothetical protein